MNRVDLAEVYRSLLAAQGPQGWWPPVVDPSADRAGPLEVMVAAVLAQNTAWPNAAKALAELHRATGLAPEVILALPDDTLAGLIRPSGYYNLKARRLRPLMALLVERYHGSVQAMAQVPTGELRAELLGLWGIGPETADSILCYGFDRPVMVSDAYTRRILHRLGLTPPDASYEELQGLLADAVPPGDYGDFHAQLVRLGSERCRKRPRCDGCPLRAMCPMGG